MAKRRIDGDGTCEPRQLRYVSPSAASGINDTSCVWAVRDLFLNWITCQYIASIRCWSLYPSSKLLRVLHESGSLPKHLVTYSVKKYAFAKVKLNILSSLRIQRPVI